jgi:hypothetical protein
LLGYSFSNIAIKLCGWFVFCLAWLTRHTHQSTNYD